jgi:PmbA protein
MIGQVLEIALQEAQQAEVYQSLSESTMAHFEANRLKRVESRQSDSVALRVVRDGRIGFASAGGAIEPRELVRMAIETSAFGATARLQFPGGASFPSVAVYDDRVAAIETSTLIHIGAGVVERVTTHDSEVQCEGMVSVSAGKVRILNSSGLDTSYRKTSLGLFMEGIRVNGSDMLFVGDSMSSTELFTVADAVADTMIAQLERASRSASIHTGTYPVLFTPHGVGAALLMPLAVAFNGKNVVDRASRLAGRQGEQLFAASLTLRDDATMSGRTSSAPCDAEGSPSRAVSLIDEGTVRAFLYDLQTAGDAETESTASAHRADARSQIRPGMSSFVLACGETSFSEILASIDEGLVVEELIGAGQGNLLAGDFGGNVLLGYKVEKGEIVGRVKNTMIAGNVMEVLARSVTVGNDSRWVGGSLHTPSLLCEGVSVSSGGGVA